MVDLEATIASLLIVTSEFDKPEGIAAFEIFFSKEETGFIEINGNSAAKSNPLLSFALY
jgi:hypothetical protein